MADALLIAAMSGGDLLARAHKEYMRRCPRPYMKLLSAVMEQDLAGRAFTILAPVLAFSLAFCWASVALD